MFAELAMVPILTQVDAAVQGQTMFAELAMVPILTTVVAVQAVAIGSIYWWFWRCRKKDICAAVRDWKAMRDTCGTKPVSLVDLCAALKELNEWAASFHETTDKGTTVIACLELTCGGPAGGEWPPKEPDPFPPV